MKYVIMKNGRTIDLSGWEIDCEIGDYYSLLYYDEDGNCKDGFMLSKKDILKQADTIPELCDGFYYDDETEIFIKRFYHYNKNAGYFICDEDDSDKLFKEGFKTYGHTLYGFIKTEKGLIFKTKINDKGESELL